MNIIITMAGLGSRFRKAGYEMPKYMIKARGKTLFEWSMDSLLGYHRHVSKYVFVVRREDGAADFIREQSRRYGIQQVEVVEIDHMTDGQATTCMLAIPFCNPEESVLIYNIDTYVEAGEMNSRELRGDGFIPCFKAEGDHWSFVRLDEAGRVAEIKEKKRISDYCTLGAYYFRTCRLYKNLYDEYYGRPQELVNGEKYVAPLYDYLLSRGGEIYISVIRPEKVHVLGTPEELQDFLNDIAAGQNVL